MRKTKLLMFIIAIFAITLTILSQGSLAYYSSIGRATNVVTSGNIQFIIHETTDQGTEFPKEGVYIVPGDIVSKEVSVENVCEHPFYLRVKIVYGIDSRELSAEDCFKLNIDEENWHYKDGWYYWDGSLTDIPEKFSIPSDCSAAYFHQHKNNGRKYDVFFTVQEKMPKEECFFTMDRNSYWLRDAKRVTLTSEEREELELYMISNPLVKSRSGDFNDDFCTIYDAEIDI